MDAFTGPIESAVVELRLYDGTRIEVRIDAGDADITKRHVFDKIVGGSGQVIRTVENPVAINIEIDGILGNAKIIRPKKQGGDGPDSATTPKTISGSP
jgi:hypothetical protein